MPRKRRFRIPRLVKKGTTMETWQAFLLGVMVAWTPSLAWFAYQLWRQSDFDRDARWR